MRALVLTIFFSAAMLGWAASGQAATIEVNTSEDVVASDGLCSLREAIINARNGNQSGSVDCAAGSVGSNTIVFHRSLANATITLNGTALHGAVGEMIIQGPVSGNAGGLTLNANLDSRIMSSSGSGMDATLTILRDLTLTQGRIEGPNRGGAIFVANASLRLENVIVQNSLATGTHSLGGGLYGANARIELIDSLISDNVSEAANGHGGGITIESGELQLLRSQILDNRTLGQGAHGGGIWAGPAQGSAEGSAVHIVDSVIAGNSTQGSSTHGGGVFSDLGSVHIENSTIFGNSTITQAGGVRVSNGNLSLINSTVSGNSGGTTGGVRVMHGSGTLLHSTVAFNHAPPSYGRDISLFGSTSLPASLDLVNSLVVQADSGALTCLIGSHSSIASLNSLSTHASCTGVATAPESIHLGPLANNGGRTLTHALWPASVAIDAGGDCQDDFQISEDQRGEPRPGGISSACDLGAYEVQGPPPTADLQIVKSVSPAAAEVGDIVTFTLTATNLGPDQARGVFVIDQLPSGYTFVSATPQIGSFDEATGLWEIGRMSASFSRTLIIEAMATGINDYVNTATIQGERFDPDLSNNSDQATPAITPHQVDLEILKMVDPLESAIDEIVTFTLTAGNRGPDPATGVIVVDQLPSGFAFVSASSDVGAYDPSSGQWLIGELAFGQQEQLQIEARVLGFTDYLNVATISGDQDDPEPSNNSASAEPYIPPPPEAIIVNTLLDVVAEDGLCSLREAIINAQSLGQPELSDCAFARTVRFDESLIGGTIELNGSPLPTVVEELHLEGPVPGDPGGLTIDARGLSRIFDMNNSADFSIRDMTLTGGRTTAAAAHGGAIRMTDNTHAVLERVRLEGNVVENASGGAIYSHDSVLIISDSEFIGNQVLSATGSGGAIDAHLREISLLGSTLAENISAGNGGGINLNRSELNMVNSTLSGNSAGGSGGAINVDRSTATLIHTTMAFNEASSGGSGIYGLATADDPVELSLLNSLIVNNACNFTGGAHVTVTVSGTQSTHSGCLLGSGVQVTPAGMIRLLPLGRYGGVTLTHGLDTGSSAIDYVRFCQSEYGIEQDQRGAPRPGGSSMVCDVGAFEFNPGDGDTIFGSRFDGALK